MVNAQIDFQFSKHGTEQVQGHDLADDFSSGGGGVLPDGYEA